MSELLVYQKAYTLLLDVFKRTDAFPKSKRFSLGQRLEASLLDFVTLANGFRYARDKDARVRQMTVCFDEIKLLLKIAHDTKLISREVFAVYIVSADEIGRMLGGLARKKNVARSDEI